MCLSEWLSHCASPSNNIAVTHISASAPAFGAVTIFYYSLRDRSLWPCISWWLMMAKIFSSTYFSSEYSLQWSVYLCTCLPFLLNFFYCPVLRILFSTYLCFVRPMTYNYFLPLSNLSFYPPHMGFHTAKVFF